MSAAEGARVRAAEAYKGLARGDLAAALNVSVTTLNRIKKGERSISQEEREKIAKLCEVPVGWLQHGWASAEFAPTEQRLRDLEEALGALVDAWPTLARRSAAGGDLPLGPELLRRLRDRRRAAEGHEQENSPPGPDDQLDSGAS